MLPFLLQFVVEYLVSGIFFSYFSIVLLAAILRRRRRRYRSTVKIVH